MAGTENILQRKSHGTAWVLSTLALAMIVLSVSSGCRCLSPKTTPVTTAPTEAPPFLESPAPAVPNSTTVYKPPVLTEEFTASASAFRPIVPEHLRETPVGEPAPLPVATPTKNDEQADRIRQLERALAESEAKARDAQKAAEKVLEETARKAAAEPRPIPPVTTEVRPETVKPARRAPVLTAPGLTVTTEADRIRFSVTDQAIFVPGTNRIAPEAEETFRKIVAEIRSAEPNASLEIEGHTDSLNVDPANPMKKHEISSIKAVAVMEFFVKSLLWSHENIRTSAHGASRPVADNGTPEGRLKNNRIDIVVIPK